MASRLKNSTRVPHSSTRTGRRVYNIREVAMVAGASVATVSRALTQPNVVAPGTLKRVLAVIDRLGYTPNAQATILRTARTRLIVALVPDISNPFFSEVIRGIEKVAHQHEYSVLLGDTQHSKVRESAYANLVSTRQADGIITLLPHLPNVSTARPIPLVNACEYINDASVTSVYVDNKAAARLATSYLIKLGHRRIAFLSGLMNTPIRSDREAGYELALHDADLKRDPKLTIHGDFSIESGAQAVKSLFATRRQFSAIFCSNDEMAMGAMQIIKTRGLRIPKDISVIGFDDIRYARYTDPPLTTIAQPKEALGREAMTLLLELFRDATVPVRKRILPIELVVRGSTAPPSNASK
jgi:LacI family transcriptional regulator, repressor for deo operon, udp, cdd, tsx, nupC, and nupG